jgi:hypothetical protein
MAAGEKRKESAVPTPRRKTRLHSSSGRSKPSGPSEYDSDRGVETIVDLFDQYLPAPPLKLPHRTMTYAELRLTVHRYTEYRINGPIDDRMFALPK